MNATRREYLKRINFVLDFIETNLIADLSLDRLAKKAHYSPYHFHRVFSTVVGEKLNEFVNRKRIERIASILLVRQNITLKDLAYQYGFNSDNSFSRAFKKYYGISPTQFKLDGKKLLSKIGIEPYSSKKYIWSIDHTKQWIEMNAQIIVKELPVIKLASISHFGEFDKMGKMYHRLMEWGLQKEILATSDLKTITIYHDNPHVTHTSKLRFSACVTINQRFKADGDIQPRTIQKGTYAIGHFEIKAEEIAKAWKSMSIWVIENGYEFRDADFFEMYHNDPGSHPEQKFVVDICIPLEKTDNIKLVKSNNISLSGQQEHGGLCENQLDYHQLISYMKELKAFFHKEYGSQFKLGHIYQGNPNFSYFSLTTENLKKQKLKFVIILNHQTMCFSICLSGQNKGIRKKYWEIFSGSDWNKYHLAEDINESLSIIDQMMVEKPDLNDKIKLTERIEKEALKFINNIIDLLE